MSASSPLVDVQFKFVFKGRSWARGNIKFQTP
jgi:hypothetical protein